MASIYLVVVAIGGVNMLEMCIQRLCLRMFVLSFFLELPTRCASSRPVCQFASKSS